MRILILALTFGLGLTLNAKEENSISKKDSIHFIDGSLIMANDTISLDEFIVFAEKKSGATVRYLKQAKKAMRKTENPELAKEGREKVISAWGSTGAILGAVGGVSGIGIMATSDLSQLDGWGQLIVGGAITAAGIAVAGISMLGAVVGSAINQRKPLMSSAHHKLEANRLIDKAVNSYNR